MTTNYLTNIKNSSAFKSIYIHDTQNMMYSNMVYGDKLNKICFMFTPRGGCSVSFQCYLELLGLLKEALEYHKFIHEYRMKFFFPNIPYINFSTIYQQKYIIIKIIVNPYSRAVSIWRAQLSHNYSFREYLQKVIDKTIVLSQNDIYHSKQQYMKNEEKYITKYIKLEDNETYSVILHDGTQFIINLNKYSSIHHGIRDENINYFVGDLPTNTFQAKLKLPKYYKYFYDDMIKNMVDILFEEDIKMYNYSFDDLF